MGHDSQTVEYKRDHSRMSLMRKQLSFLKLALIYLISNAQAFKLLFLVRVKASSQPLMKTELVKMEMFKIKIYNSPI